MSTTDIARTRSVPAADTGATITTEEPPVSGLRVILDVHGHHKQSSPPHYTDCSFTIV